MKEADWEDCLYNNTARIISPDCGRARSLIETADERISLINEVNERNCNFVFEDYYASIVEIIQARLFLLGFNVLNHVCLGFYLRDVMNRDDLFNIYDDLRYKRNSLTYYGTRMDYATAKQAIMLSKKMIKELKEL
ncbi:MAG: hypothetical protein ACMXYL_04190 [Candidatus Woesearchaeota archaeon]